MTEKKPAFPLTKDQVQELITQYPTPWHIYDEKAIRENARSFIKAFSWVKGPNNTGFKNYFAVKALPNPFILKIVKDEGMGTDCSSLPELLLAEKVGFSGEEIMFSSNDTPAEEFIKAKELGAIINLDDITHIDFLEECAGIPEMLCFRYNPGPLKQGNVIIGKPEEAKYGLTHDQIIEAYKIAKKKGVTRFGLHTMVASNELNPDYFVETARILFQLVVEIKKKVEIKLEFVNMGGGIGVQYKPEQVPVDLNKVSAGIKKEYEKIVVANKLAPLRIVMECGRMVTGPYGWLVSTVRHVTKKYKDYVGMDACMANLMRPAMYGAYHHITVLGKEDWPLDHKYDVTGSLCENNDKFAIDRMLPEMERGDIIAIHTTGAHGFAMGFQYNGKLRSAELLLRPNGDVTLIRRAETPDDYFGTFDFDALNQFE
ncbi:MAG TPA: diaminopimelate decarboxylase [Candidatus Lokiarchaeia archaeon]|nr:diaminopimelate decarboxylase [Candidatus Lokiarchaeia archaeon]